MCFILNLNPNPFEALAADVGLEPAPADSAAAHIRGPGRTLRRQGALLQSCQRLLPLIWKLRGYDSVASAT